MDQVASAEEGQPQEASDGACAGEPQLLPPADFRLDALPLSGSVYLNFVMLNKEDLVRKRVHARVGAGIMGLGLLQGAATRFAQRMVDVDTVTAKAVGALARNLPDKLIEMGVTAEVTMVHQKGSFAVLRIHQMSVDPEAFMSTKMGNHYAAHFRTILWNLKQLQLDDDQRMGCILSIREQLGTQIRTMMPRTLEVSIPAKFSEIGMECALVARSGLGQCEFFFSLLETGGKAEAVAAGASAVAVQASSASMPQVAIQKGNAADAGYPGGGGGGGGGVAAAGESCEADSTAMSTAEAEGSLDEAGESSGASELPPEEAYRRPFYMNLVILNKDEVVKKKIANAAPSRGAFVGLMSGLAGGVASWATTEGAMTSKVATLLQQSIPALIGAEMNIDLECRVVFHKESFVVLRTRLIDIRDPVGLIRKAKGDEFADKMAQMLALVGEVMEDGQAKVINSMGDKIRESLFTRLQDEIPLKMWEQASMKVKLTSVDPEDEMDAMAEILRELERGTTTSGGTQESTAATS